MKKFSFSLVLFFSIGFSGISAQGTEDNRYQQIRDYIDSNRIAEAQSLLDEWIRLDPNDATIQLYQTEVWIRIADQKYKDRKFKTAFVYYEKAFANWPNNPSVRARYIELKDKRLVDHANSSPILKTRFTPFGSQVGENGEVISPFKEMNESLKQIRDEIHILQEKSNAFYLTLSLISVSILLQCFILLRLGFRR
ncbi:tetratricopeptide repeat protein [Leptospira stimsonii]|uniref:Tetratricopeptide repeat protein n=1 Tax=Leptospira stimsonii TaxID=2202203 RepID=A0A396YR26_9LEPT|nr:tetratricopeptide repeat protein [Leptospira stimsonii]RHX83927.1 hypothetical protein DLM75_23580 [Leptospira stimsonii]